MNAVEIARKIWADPELSLKEYNAEKLYAQALREEGFEVEEGVGGIPTAVFGKYGAGKPVIAGEEGICAGCGVATLSINYYDIGYVTGEMAYEILVNGADVSTMPIAYAPEVTKKYNAENAAALNVAIPEDYVAID